MTREYLDLLVDFHYWARDRVLAAVAALDSEQYARPLGSSFSSVRDTLNHLYFAEWVWYRRWHGESPRGMPSVDLPDLATLRATWSEHEAKLRAFVRGLDEAGVARVLDYTLFSGQAGSSPMWQMVVHLVNHGSYHRGQVVTLLRQLGAKPPQSTDLITFFRERSASSGRT
jgi:uncharacterized damage-inducible protein DinB